MTARYRIILYFSHDNLVKLQLVQNVRKCLNIVICINLGILHIILIIIFQGCSFNISNDSDLVVPLIQILYDSCFRFGITSASDMVLLPIKIC